MEATYQLSKNRVQLEEADSFPESQVSTFYAGASLLLTGGTDFFGKCLLEKLLRSCADLDRVYLLVRVRETEDFYRKSRALFDDDVFNALREIDPDFARKVHPVRGDLTREDLGLSSADRELITGRVQFIFHNGAARGLRERPGLTLRTNVLGTGRMLELARQCPNLRGFVLVSTIFSQAAYDCKKVKEVFAEPPADLKAVQDMIDADCGEVGLTRDSLKMLIGKWHNVYTFSEAMAEDLVRRQAIDSPFASCVFRPSAVTSTYREPLERWCDKKNGPALFFIKMAMGAIHVINDSYYAVDIVPADLAVNGMIVCTRNAVSRWKTKSEAFVYNFGTSRDNLLTIKDIQKNIMAEPDALVSSASRRMPYVFIVDNYLIFVLLRIFCDFIPALIIDLLTLLHGETPTALAMFRESISDMHCLDKWLFMNWRSVMDETLKAANCLNARDRDLFFCDVRQLNWAEYFKTYWCGIRRYVLKESMKDIADTVSRHCCSFSCCRHRSKCKCHCKGAYVALLFVFLAFAYFFVKAWLF